MFRGWERAKHVTKASQFAVSIPPLPVPSQHVSLWPNSHGLIRGSRDKDESAVHGSARLHANLGCYPLRNIDGPTTQ